MQRPSPKGSSTEIAFLKFIEEICEMNYDNIRKQYTIVHKFPFTSQRKRMSTIISDPNNLGKNTRLVIKGASELILESCTRFHSFNDEIINLNSDVKKSISEAIENMASQALRTLILAYKDLSEVEGYLFFFI